MMKRQTNKHLELFLAILLVVGMSTFGFGPVGCKSGDDDDDTTPVTDDDDDDDTTTDDDDDDTIDCIDNDGDGYGVGDDCLGTDCDDDDESVHNTCEVPAGMAVIPTGCFDMGDAFDEGESYELPVHNVCITAFYMNINEVTNAEYKACVDAGDCTAPSSVESYSRLSYYGNATFDDYPVVYVSYTQAVTFCTAAGKRLPTEAEWEYAARGGLSDKRFPWGDTITCADATYYADDSCIYDVEGTTNYCTDDTSEVGSYTVNGYGLYDMAGNVWEWVHDWCDTSYYDISPTDDPTGPATGIDHVLRGGSWFDYAADQRVSSRRWKAPSFTQDLYGFRCAASSTE
jgi:formylglycine-generating enzyme required for sulfatase activity